MNKLDKLILQSVSLHLMSILGSQFTWVEYFVPCVDERVHQPPRGAFLTQEKPWSSV